MRRRRSRWPFPRRRCRRRPGKSPPSPCPPTRQAFPWPGARRTRRSHPRRGRCRPRRSCRRRRIPWGTPATWSPSPRPDRDWVRRRPRRGSSSTRDRRRCSPWMCPCRRPSRRLGHLKNQRSPSLPKSHRRSSRRAWPRSPCRSPRSSRARRYCRGGRAASSTRPASPPRRCAVPPPRRRQPSGPRRPRWTGPTRSISICRCWRSRPPSPRPMRRRKMRSPTPCPKPSRRASRRYR